MTLSPEVFYPAVLATGAIIAGFCGTFLSFRIQREANYYRQPAVDFNTAKARDVYVGLSHFTSSFLLLGIATLLSLLFGVALPLLALSGIQWALVSPRTVVAGLLGAVVFLVGYFVDELVHYEILSTNLTQDAHEWGSERWIVWVTIGGAVGTAAVAVLA